MPTRSHLAILFLAVLILSPSTVPSQVVELRKGDHICLIGNALGERLQFVSDWEALLHTRFPHHELTVRNLCFPADEPYQRDRSLNFGTPDDHLKHSEADVILCFFGLNESFAGRAGVPEFARELTRLVKEMSSQNYSGRGAPRIVLISPIAYEDLGHPHLPDASARNAELARYTEAMRDVAAQTGAAFVDVHGPTARLFRESKESLTINGIHLSDEGNKRFAPLLDEGLFGERPNATPISTRLAAEIDDKSFHWWHRYRAVNGYSIYGTRGEAGFDGTYRNREVMERERAILDQMCANRDRRIWALAQGKTVPDQVDDSNTLTFLPVKTNVGGNNDPNRKAGKLGSLDYLPAAEQLKHFRLAPGYEISLVASEEDFPELAKPVAINFDSEGRLWVATMPSYPQWQPKSPLDDKLLILDDRDGDGRADHCQVFAGGLHQPTGFELGHGGVYVAQQPDVLFLKDTDGDGRADVRVRQLIGFDTADSHHGLAAFEWGPDGALYFQEGTFKQSQVETPYGPIRLGDAGVWRYEPRSERLDVHVSLSFANPWGHVFDRWGQNFIADASPGFNYWAAPISGFVAHPDKHPGGCRDAHLDWGGPRSKRPYPTFITKRIRPSSGCEIVSSRNFPPEAQGNFLVNNVIGDLGVLQYTRHDEKSGFGGQEITPLILSDHGNFRPVDLQFGPDGALYIADWHNALIGHLQHNLRDPSRDHEHGRIWRIRYQGRPLVTPPRIAGEPIAALLELLKSPEDRTRYRARRELAARDTRQVVAEVKTWVSRLDRSSSEYEQLLLEALWLFQTHHVVNDELLKRTLDSPDFRARAAATRVLCEWREQAPDALDLLAARIRDPHPRVRLEAVRACSFVHTQQGIEMALEVLNYDLDDNLDYTLDETLRALESVLGRSQLAQADHAHHDHAAHADHAGHDAPGQAAAIIKPIVFLQKSPRIVEYQLDRLSASQLLLVDRSPDQPQSMPVYRAILLRPGMPPQERQEALAALARLNGSSETAEAFAALGQLDWNNRGQRRVIEQLASLMLGQRANDLKSQRPTIQAQSGSSNLAVRAVAFAALLKSDDVAATWKTASASEQGRADFLAAVPLVPERAVRAALRDYVVECLSPSQPEAIRNAAIEVLASIPSQQEQSFQLLSPYVGLPRLRAAAVRTLLQIPQPYRSADGARQVVQSLVDYAEKTPAARRTTDEFLDAMQLADELLGLLPVDESRPLRQRLRAVVVRVVRINTVHEEMRYDTPFFAAEAGRPVQLVLRNQDLMPHNLVITTPGSLRDVAQLAALMPPQIDKSGRQYVPKDSAVLFSTRMVEPNQQDVLTFTAPSEPGEYPYVCTFPNHWMRMYGVMVVVADLEKWQANPVKPADPLGITRELVQNWTIDDFDGTLDAGLEGRQPDVGRQIFKEATCLLCHRMHGEGGAVGPELTDVFTRLKGDRPALLREVLDPSHKVDPKYALYNVITSDGKTLAGVIANQDQDAIILVSNPENPQPQTLSRDDIDEIVKSSASLMPKGLLDRYTRDEIFELLWYLEKAPKPAPARD